MRRDGMASILSVSAQLAQTLLYLHEYEPNHLNARHEPCCSIGFAGRDHCSTTTFLFLILQRARHTTTGSHSISISILLQQINITQSDTNSSNTRCCECMHGKDLRFTPLLLLCSLHLHLRFLFMPAKLATLASYFLPRPAYCIQMKLLMWYEMT